MAGMMGDFNGNKIDFMSWSIRHAQHYVNDTIQGNNNL